MLGGGVELHSSLNWDVGVAWGVVLIALVGGSKGSLHIHATI